MHEILIYDIIGYDFWTGGGITAKYIKRELDAAKNAKKGVLCRINSPGGSVSEGLAIYNLFNDYAADGMEITMQVDGIAMSMAACIMMAGTKTVAAENSVILVHNAWGCTCGNAREMESTMEMLKAFDSGLISTVASKTGQSEDSVRAKWFDYADHSFTAKQALAEGLIDEIKGKSDAKVPENMSNMKAQDAFDWYVSNKSGDKKASGSMVKKIAKAVVKAMTPAVKPNDTTTTNNDTMSKLIALAAFMNAKADERTEDMRAAMNAELKAAGINFEVIAAGALEATAQALQAEETLRATAQASLQTATAEVTRLTELCNANSITVKTGNDVLDTTPKNEHTETSVDREKRELQAKFKD